jgi:hypothetical protein
MITIDFNTSHSQCPPPGIQGDTVDYGETKGEYNLRVFNKRRKIELKSFYYSTLFTCVINSLYLSCTNKKTAT